MATSIVEQVTQKIITALEGITVANGYENNVADVLPPVYGGPDPQDRRIVIMQGERNPVDQSVGPDGFQTWDQYYYLLCHVAEEENSQTSLDSRCNSIAADVEKALAADITLGGVADELFLYGTTPFDNHEGVVVTCAVRFRHLNGNPCSK